MIRRIVTGAASIAIAISPAGSLAQTLSPVPVFESNTRLPPKIGTAQGVHVTVQSWGIPNEHGAMQDIPLRGFYVAHLLSGNLLASIGGQTTAQSPGSYWTVKAGATMQVKVTSEYAVLETIVTARQ